jgi:hydroxyacylglutathione hydrolase
MITHKIFSFNPFQVNTFVLYATDKSAVVIDPAMYNSIEQKEFDDFIKTNNLTITASINTHGHVDHVAGNEYIFKTYGIKTSIHPADTFLLNLAEEHGNMFGLNTKNPPADVLLINDGDKILFGDEYLRVIHLPGHTPGGIGLLNDENKILIAGDTLFRNGIGRTDLIGGNHEQIIKSIKNNLFLLSEDIEVYCGHGPTTTIGYEKRTNPFII